MFQLLLKTINAVIALAERHALKQEAKAALHRAKIAVLEEEHKVAQEAIATAKSLAEKLKAVL
jgi:hypothetical protein